MDASDHDSAGSNLPVMSVSELSQALKRTVEEAYAWVRVRGEISGFKRARSGHLYFALKDVDAVLDAVCWRNTAGRLALVPEDGLEVVATGRLTTYPGRSRYQIVVAQLELAGEGALLKLLETRKRALAAEGLFDEARKRAPPFLPTVIGVVTSPTGAVLRDILHRLGDRFPRRVLVWPVLVQGEGAAEQVAQAIAGFNRLAPDGAVPRPDLLIVARGGGSLEDLWAFNEEAVVRAAAASEIPLIAAVGHETDTTLIDLAADRRAPTPSAAAELAVPVRGDLVTRLLGLEQRLVGAAHRALEARRTRLDGYARGLPGAPSLLMNAAQRLDDWSERLGQAAGGALVHRSRLVASLNPPHPKHVLSLKRAQLTALAERPALRTPGERIVAAQDGLARVVDGLRPALEACRRHEAARLETAGRLLESVSYRGTLARGYAVVRGDDDRPLMSSKAVKPGAALSLEFHDGRAPAISAARRVRRRGKPSDDQGSLL